MYWTGGGGLMHLSILSWRFINQYPTQYSFQATGCFPHITIVETMDSGEMKMILVAMTIINSMKKYLPKQGSNQRPPGLKSGTLSTELWRSASSLMYCTKVILNPKRYIRFNLSPDKASFLHVCSTGRLKHHGRMSDCS